MSSEKLSIHECECRATAVVPIKQDEAYKLLVKINLTPTTNECHIESHICNIKNNNVQVLEHTKPIDEALN